jgi:phage FluMu protein Com
MEDLTNILVNRRKSLSLVKKTCPRCKESNQIQLLYYTSLPVDWRCRKCKFVWQTNEKGEIVNG